MGRPFRMVPMPIRSYRDLIVWQKSVDLAARVYRISDQFPSKERFAEGHERHSRGDFRRHVSIASGSYAELETLVEIASPAP